MLVVNLGPAQSAELHLRAGRGSDQTLWSGLLPEMPAGEPLRVRLEVGDGKTLIRLNDKSAEVANVRLATDEYHLELWSWPPTSQWTVRKVSVK